MKSILKSKDTAVSITIPEMIPQNYRNKDNLVLAQKLIGGQVEKSQNAEIS